MENIATLPLLPFGRISRQVSSRDKTGGNDDGFMGHTHLFEDTKGRYVVFDDYGPGCIDRMWFTQAAGEDGDIEIFVDDVSVPKVSASMKDLFRGKVQPFGFPLVNSQKQSSGGWVSYFPICYQKQGKITLSKPPFFYNITYHRFPADQQIRSFTGKEDTANVLWQWKHLGKDPKAKADTKVINSRAMISPKEKSLVLDFKGAGAIWTMSFQPKEMEAVACERLWLRAWFDGHDKPDIDAPFFLFFGGCDSDKIPAALLIGKNGEKFYSYFPMPFWSDVKFEIENLGDESVEFENKIELLQTSYPKDAGYFNARYKEESATLAGRDYIASKIDGAGNFLGMTLSMKGADPRKYLQGDERFLLDDLKTPSIWGTGAEDYFNGGWLFKYGEFERPLHGATAKMQVSGDFLETCCYRFHLGDRITFYGKGVFGIEHDGFNEIAGDHYRSVAYYYIQPNRHLELSDQLFVGDHQSKSDHRYEVFKAAPVEPNPARWDCSGEKEERLSGVLLSGRSEFILKVNPKNQGVILRRTYDQSHAPQTARILVDGQPAGIWHEPFQNETRPLTQSDFPLPRSLTEGKKSLQIRIESIGENPWSEFEYNTLCVMGGR